MRLTLSIVCILLFGWQLEAQDKPAYVLLDAKGKEVRYERMLKDLANADVVLFGELHNDPIAHWMQLELTKDLHAAKGSNLQLGAEMFERDDQLLIDEYFAGLIAQRNFEEEARTWSNYKTDYKPLLEFARENELRFVASNVPRRYASMVFNQGIERLEELGDEAKQYLPPLPILIDLELECYQEMLEMMGGHGNPETTQNFPKAQAVKDASMAWFILQELDEDALLLHFNGAFHSDKHQGIAWYLEHYRPGVAVKTLTTVRQANLNELEEEHMGKADYILVVPETMTNTY